tara:strand:+ start:1534 stop:1704 length:171 start_codon:yes stop_codon:yes gene_type:complete
LLSVLHQEVQRGGGVSAPALVGVFSCPSKLYTLSFKRDKKELEMWFDLTHLFRVYV